MVLILLGVLSLVGWVGVASFAWIATYWHKRWMEIVQIARSNQDGWDRALTRERQYMAMLGMTEPTDKVARA